MNSRVPRQVFLLLRMLFCGCLCVFVLAVPAFSQELSYQQLENRHKLIQRLSQQQRRAIAVMKNEYVGASLEMRPPNPAKLAAFPTLDKYPNLKFTGSSAYIAELRQYAESLGDGDDDYFAAVGTRVVGGERGGETEIKQLEYLSHLGRAEAFRFIMGKEMERLRSELVKIDQLDEEYERNKRERERQKLYDQPFERSVDALGQKVGVYASSVNNLARDYEVIDSNINAMDASIEKVRILAQEISAENTVLLMALATCQMAEKNQNRIILEFVENVVSNASSAQKILKRAVEQVNLCRSRESVEKGLAFYRAGKKLAKKASSEYEKLSQSMVTIRGLIQTNPGSEDSKKAFLGLVNRFRAAVDTEKRKIKEATKAIAAIASREAELSTRKSEIGNEIDNIANELPGNMTELVGRLNTLRGQFNNAGHILTGVKHNSRISNNLITSKGDSTFSNNVESVNRSVKQVAGLAACNLADETEWAVSRADVAMAGIASFWNEQIFEQGSRCLAKLEGEKENSRLTVKKPTRRPNAISDRRSYEPEREEVRVTLNSDQREEEPPSFDGLNRVPKPKPPRKPRAKVKKRKPTPTPDADFEQLLNDVAGDGGNRVAIRRNKQRLDKQRQLDRRAAEDAQAWERERQRQEDAQRASSGEMNNSGGKSGFLDRLAGAARQVAVADQQHSRDMEQIDREWRSKGAAIERRREEELRAWRKRERQREIADNQPATNRRVATSRNSGGTGTKQSHWVVNIRVYWDAGPSAGNSWSARARSQDRVYHFYGSKKEVNKRTNSLTNHYSRWAKSQGGYDNLNRVDKSIFFPMSDSATAKAKYQKRCGQENAICAGELTGA